jgi:hypothetical protein
VRNGRKHDVWSDGRNQEAVPRHAEINERLALATLARVKRVNEHEISRRSS